MTLNNIIVTTNNFHSQHKQDLINSNNFYITKLFQHQLSEDHIFQEALLSYYLDFYESHIVHGGFYKFIESYAQKTKILYYIHTALKTMKCKKHLELFENIFHSNALQHSQENAEKLDSLFHEYQSKASLLDVNYAWMMNHPKLHIIPEKDFERQVRMHLLEAQNEKRHVKIIKQLCKIINEDFVAITAGDQYNLYTQSWYFKTTQNYYYMIQKNHIVSLYNSFSKELVTEGRLVVNKTDHSFISNFISKILA